MEQDKSAAVPQESYPGLSAGGSVDAASDESGQQNGQTDSPQQSTAAGGENSGTVSSAPNVDVLMEGEETSSQPENESQPENTSEIVFFGSWYVSDYRTSSTYALSQEEIDEFLTYGLAYYEDGFSLKGTMVVEGDLEYTYTDYTKEEVEEQFNVDMTGWWNESDTIAYIGITAAESDENPSLRYCFGTQFFAVDMETIWIYYEGVFFQAKRAGA